MGRKMTPKDVRAAVLLDGLMRRREEGGESPLLTQADVMDVLDVSQGTASRRVQRLVEAGMLKRELGKVGRGESCERVLRKWGVKV